MNCLIENEYIRELSLPKKNTYVFPNELPNWKRILKGKNGKIREKKVGVLYCGGVLLLWTGSWRTLLRGVINAMWTLYGYDICCRWLSVWKWWFHVDLPLDGELTIEHRGLKRFNADVTAIYSVGENSIVYKFIRVWVPLGNQVKNGV